MSGENSLPVGNQYIPRTTPHHVAQLVLLLIRETFRSLDTDHPLHYTDDFSTTGIHFDTVYNKESGVYGGKPLVLVSRGGLNTAPIAMGDRAFENLKANTSRSTGLVYSSIIVKALADSHGQAEILANEVFNMLITCRTFLPSLTSVLQLQNMSLSEVMEYDEGDHKYYATASVSYAMQYKWVTMPDEDLLTAVYLALRTNDLTLNTLELVDASEEPQ